MPAVKRSTSRRKAQSPYRRSANVERDSGATASADFIVTTCARRSLGRLLNGLRPDSLQRAWTLTGPYGTGKSSFCLFLAELIAPHAATSRCSREAVAQVDQPLADLVKSSFGTHRGLATVLVTCTREPLQLTISRRLADALRQLKQPSTSRLAAELEAVTPGRTPSSVVAVFQRAAKALTDKTRGAQGCLLILDEMGKALEFAATNPELSDVYLLQQLAEAASAPTSGLAILGVLHQDFSGYAKTLLAAQQQEWEKVRGRFDDIVFEQSAEDMLRLIADALSRQAPTSPPKLTSYRRLWETTLRLGTALRTEPGPDLRPILDSCRPLHPIVAMLLGPVFKRFGQNERSAFSFLRSAEPGGLPDFAARCPASVYRLSDLYQYLTGTFGDALLASRDGRRWAEAFAVEAQHPRMLPAECDVLHTIAMLNIVGRWHGLTPTADCIAASVSPGLTTTEALDAIRSLEGKSAVVFRKFNKSYSLWEGSDIDVEARIAEARAGQAADTPTEHLLRGIYAPRPMVARRHSFERGTFRYFDVVLASPNTSEDREDVIARSAADGHVMVLLHTFSDPRKVQEDLVKSLTATPGTLLCIPANAREIDTLARDLHAVDTVERSVRELHNDQTALRELVARKDEIRRRLDSALARLLTTEQTAGRRPRWIRQGTELRLRSRRELYETLSAVCDDLFPDCPVIQNEIINRRELSSSAAAAQGALLQAMVDRGAVEGLGITGNPPEKSIYLSVLHRLGLHQKHGDQWDFSTGPNGLDASIRPLMKAIRRFFDDSASATRSLDQLFRLMRAPPFGVRDGVVPIIAVASLLAHEADVALYENGAFLPQLTKPTLERLVKDPAAYGIRRWHVDGVRAIVFSQLAEMLGQSTVAGKIGQRDLLDVVKPLLRFVRRLNDFTRSTRTFSPTALAVRQALLEASEPDQLLFTQLPTACELSPFSAKRKRPQADVEQFRHTLQSALAELQKGYDALLHSLLEELGDTLEAPPHPRGVRTSLRQRAAAISTFALSPELKVFCTRLAETSSDDRAWIESIASFLSNKHPSQWTDDDRARLSVRLGQVASAFRALETLALSRKSDKVDDTEESIQLGVVGTSFQESRLVVHVAPGDAEAVTALERELWSILEARRIGPDRRLMLAALARVVQSALSDSHPTSNGSF